MKIAIDIRDADGEKTGKGYYSYSLVKKLIQKDQQNEYFLFTNNKKTPFQESENIKYIRLYKKGFSWHLKALNKIKQIKPDIYFSPVSFIVPALAPKWLNSIIVVHDLVAFLYPKFYNLKSALIQRLLLKTALNKCSKAIVVSENTQNDLINKFDLQKSICPVINGAPNDLYRSEFKEPEEEKIVKKYKLPEKFILGVGTMEPRKNFQALIKSFVIINRKYPDYKLVIVGKNGGGEAGLKKLIKDHNIEKDVIFTGYIKDQELHYFYHRAAIFVFPSLYEGFGIPPLEAMCSGCPVVSSNSSSLPEVVSEAGLLIDPNNSVKIADAVTSIIEDSNLKHSLIERGFRRSKIYSWSNSADKLLNIFSEFKTNQ